MVRAFPKVLAFVLPLMASGSVVLAANPMVGGAPMYDTRTIVANAMNSADHTTLVAAVKAAGLVDTLQGTGPFTVFAPNNRAFEALPAGTVDTLLKPENHDALVGVLTYHVVPGALTSSDIKKGIEAGGGSYSVKTVEGETLTLRQDNGQIFVSDMTGHTAAVTIADVMQSNGVIHGIDAVLMPM